MSEVRYIPGDLVKINNRPVKLVSISSDVIEYLFLDREGDVDYDTSMDEMQPLQLTPEILEKNGWEKSDILVDEDGLEHHVYENKKNLIDIWYIPESKRFLPFIGNQHMLTFFKYVHQLQHLLFGLGLPMDLKM